MALIKRLTASQLIAAERAAWLKLADEYEAKKSGIAFGMIGICCSMCIAAGVMSVAEAMASRMEPRRPPRARAYWWPVSDWRSRVKFCRKMAALCVKKTKKNRRK